MRDGEAVDRKPIVSWPCEDQAPSGVVVRALNQALIRDPETLLLAEIPNPFGLAQSQGIDVNRLVRENPAEGGRELDRLTAETRAAINDAFARGADGILYRLHGANPEWCTPMQYGGFHLDRDRDLLESTSKGQFNILFVVGDKDVYFDFVSDLPAHAFAWDSVTTGVSCAQMRTIRRGLLAAADAEADIILASRTGSLAEALERPRANTYV